MKHGSPISGHGSAFPPTPSPGAPPSHTPPGGAFPPGGPPGLQVILAFFMKNENLYEYKFLFVLHI